MGALSGYKIIELSGIGPGPLCGMLLADLGAEVIRIDRMKTTLPPTPQKFDITGRNKKSICLNLKEDQSKEIFFKFNDKVGGKAPHKLLSRKILFTSSNLKILKLPNLIFLKLKM